MTRKQQARRARDAGLAAALAAGASLRQAAAAFGVAPSTAAAARDRHAEIGRVRILQMPAGLADRAAALAAAGRAGRRLYGTRESAA